MSAISGSSSHIPTDPHATDPVDATPAAATPLDTPSDIEAAFAEDGWTDAELMAYIDSITRQPDPMEHIRPLWAAMRKKARSKTKSRK